MIGIRQLVVGCVTALLCGCSVEFTAKPRVVGSGIVVSDVRDVKPFTRLKVGAIAHVDVTVGKERSLVVEADDNIVDVVSTEVRGDTLTIKSRGSYSTKNGVKVRITVPSLEYASVSGVGDVVVTGVSGPEFEARVSGAADLKVSGMATVLKANVSGTGDADLSELKSEVVEARVSGTGDLEIFATRALDARASGTGDIRYIGKPKKLKVSTSGVGEISPR